MCKVVLKGLAETYLNDDGTLRFEYNTVFFGPDVDQTFQNRAVDVNVDPSVSFVDFSDFILAALQKEAVEMGVSIDEDGVINPLTDRHLNSILAWAVDQINILNQKLGLDPVTVQDALVSVQASADSKID